MSQSDPKSDKTPDPKSSDRKDRELTEELEMTFPASDPPASTEPGGGITGPEPATKKG
jgi:hypothetical protein